MINTFSIQQVALHTGLTTHTLRYYERIELIGPIQRDETGHRYYTTDDIGWIELLVRLRTTGMSLEKMKQYADFQKQGDPTGAKRRQLLEEHETYMLARISELNSCLDAIRFKINIYRQLENKQ